MAVVLLENVGPHNDTRFKHLRLASGQGIRRGGPSVRVQRGGRSLLGSLRVQKGPLRVLAKILQSQCDGQRRALHSARFMWMVVWDHSSSGP